MPVPSGYKLFAVGETLEADEVNGYLIRQAVMIFTDSATRTTELSGVLREGMVTYLTSTDTLYFYNGSTWIAIATSVDIAAITARDTLLKLYMEVS